MLWLICIALLFIAAAMYNPMYLAGTALCLNIAVCKMCFYFYLALKTFKGMSL